MFNRIELGVEPQGRRWVPLVRVWIDGAEVVAEAVGAGGRGPFADEVLPAEGDGLLHATADPRRVVLGEPECTGGCCGFVSVVVRRCGGIVEWSDWEVPYEAARLPDFHFDADQYDAELARAARLRH
ncbi:hypothetical protein AB0F71_34805 [Kitasatospora sp. NPDC028055]|uniref:hypothetical protein n=1 Tax=Kitasatospora sp. NPDC028055 TaxID=3155653 RepID=UPI003404FFAA